MGSASARLSPAASASGVRCGCWTASRLRRAAGVAASAAITRSGSANSSTSGPGTSSRTTQPRRIGRTHVVITGYPVRPTKRLPTLPSRSDTAPMEPVTLRTERLLLRPFTSADADAVYRACQDADIQFYTPVPTPYRREDAEEFVAETSPKGWAEDTDFILGAFRGDNGALVGSFDLQKR